MTNQNFSIEELVAQASERAERYTHGHPEQVLTYACEDIVESQEPSRILLKNDATEFIADIAQLNNIDPPTVLFSRGNPGGLRACAVQEQHFIRFYGTSISSLTALHELAHLLSGSSHGHAFRSQLVSLLRHHSSIQQASLLHHLYVGVGLTVDPFRALT